MHHSLPEAVDLQGSGLLQPQLNWINQILKMPETLHSCALCIWCGGKCKILLAAQLLCEVDACSHCIQGLACTDAQAQAAWTVRAAPNTTPMLMSL